MLRGSRAFSGKIHRPLLAQVVPPFTTRVGTTKDQGLYNKPSAVVHPGALAAGTLPQYNTIRHHDDLLAQTFETMRFSSASYLRRIQPPPTFLTIFYGENYES